MNPPKLGGLEICRQRMTDDPFSRETVRNTMYVVTEHIPLMIGIALGPALLCNREIRENPAVPDGVFHARGVECRRDLGRLALALSTAGGCAQRSSVINLEDAAKLDSASPFEFYRTGDPALPRVAEVCQPGHRHDRIDGMKNTVGLDRCVNACSSFPCSLRNVDHGVTGH